MPQGRGKTNGRGSARSTKTSPRLKRNNSPAHGRYNRGRGRGSISELVNIYDALDVPVQMWDQQLDNTSAQTSRKGIRNTAPAVQRNQARGRGQASNGQASRFDRKRAAKTSFSQIISSERPFLRPITFVRGVHTHTLFQDEEELVQIKDQRIVEVAGNIDNDAPTANAVLRVFSGATLTERKPDFASSYQPTTDVLESEELEEIDFNELGRLELLEVSSTNQARIMGEGGEVKTLTASEVSPIESEPSIERYTDKALVDQSDLESLPVTKMLDEQGWACRQATQFTSLQLSTDSVMSTLPGVESEDTPRFYSDATPSSVDAVEQVIPSKTLPLGVTADNDDDDDIIVYVAPHPRRSEATKAEATDTELLPSSYISILTGSTALYVGDDLDSSEIPQLTTEEPSRAAPPLFSSVSFSFNSTSASAQREKRRKALKNKDKKSRKQRRNQARHSSFSAIGLANAEARLQGQDPQYEHRRRGASDVNWGSSDDRDDVDTDFVDPSDMQVDADVDLSSMQAFVRGMDGHGHSHITMEDLKEEDMLIAAELKTMQAIESNEDDSSSEADILQAFDDAEKFMLAEDVELELSMSDDSQDSDEPDRSATSVFRARLEKLRLNTPLKAGNSMPDLSDDEQDQSQLLGTWAERDEYYIAGLHKIVDGENDMLGNYPNRQEFSRPFRAVQNGNSEVLPDFIPSVGKKYDLPAEMQILFERDRQKKAEKKRLREQARLEAAADPFAKHRGGKKSRKATLRAARMDPNITVIPTRIYDMATLVSKIRSYIANPQVTHNMILPPMEKSERARVHELALAFNLASKSKGDGGIRFITLSKTRYSGTKINEQKVKRLLAESKMSFGGVPVRAKKSNTTLPKNRDGDIVGKAAPKVGASNRGFKMLAMMGWSEGERIGFGGLDVPLAAVIKNTKLGLGATR